MLGRQRALSPQVVLSVFVGLYVLPFELCATLTPTVRQAACGEEPLPLPGGRRVRRGGGRYARSFPPRVPPRAGPLYRDIARLWQRTCTPSDSTKDSPEDSLCSQGVRHCQAALPAQLLWSTCGRCWVVQAQAALPATPCSSFWGSGGAVLSPPPALLRRRIPCAQVHLDYGVAFARLRQRLFGGHLGAKRPRQNAAGEGGHAGRRPWAVFQVQGGGGCALTLYSLPPLAVKPWRSIIRQTPTEGLGGRFRRHNTGVS